MDFTLFTVLAVLITCHFLSSVSSVSLFGVNLDAPKNVIKKGFEKIPQIIDRITFLNEKSNEHWDTPPETNGFEPQQGPNFISEITTRKNHNDVYYNQVPVTPENHESYNDKEDSGPPLSKNDEIYFAEEVNSVTEAVSEYDKDYTSTTTADGEWTTIDDPLNRIANPAVVASILG